jgi:hypothetical protein
MGGKFAKSIGHDHNDYPLTVHPTMLGGQIVLRHHNQRWQQLGLDLFSAFASGIPADT